MNCGDTNAMACSVVSDLSMHCLSHLTIRPLAISKKHTLDYEFILFETVNYLFAEVTIYFSELSMLIKYLFIMAKVFVYHGKQ